MQKKHKNQPLTAEQKNLLNQLQDTTLIDARRLAGRIRGLANIKNESAKQAIIAEIEVDLTACKSRYLTRKQQAEQLKIEYLICLFPLAMTRS